MPAEPTVGSSRESTGTKKVRVSCTQDTLSQVMVGVVLMHVEVSVRRTDVTMHGGRNI